MVKLLSSPTATIAMNILPPREITKRIVPFSRAALVAIYVVGKPRSSAKPAT